MKSSKHTLLLLALLLPACKTAPKTPPSGPAALPELLRPYEDALRILQIADTITLEAGEILFEEGDMGDSFYVVLRGRVGLVKRAHGGVEHRLAGARGGEALG